MHSNAVHRLKTSIETFVTMLSIKNGFSRRLMSRTTNVYISQLRLLSN